MDINKLLPMVEKAVEGDKKAYSDLCEAIIRDVLYVCIKITGDVQLGEEAAQEALIRMRHYIKKLHNPHAFPLWLNRHLANSCRNYLRAEKRHQGREAADMLEEIAEHNVEFLPQQWAEQEDRREIVLAGLQRLSVHQQHILLMYYFQDMSTREIAVACKITEATARSNLRHARGNLKKQIERLAGAKLTGLPAATVPTITLILQRDAARLVSEESRRRVLLAVSALLTGGGAATAVASFGALAAGIAPAAVAILAAVSASFVSSPSPFPAVDGSIGITPQYSETSTRPEEGGGDLYIVESQMETRPVQAPAASDATTAPPAAAPDVQTPPEEGMPFTAAGLVALVDSQGESLAHDALDLSGIWVQAYQGTQLAAQAQTDRQGRYTLALPDDSLAYTLCIADSALPEIGRQDAGCALPPGARQAPVLCIEDRQPPHGVVYFLDADGAPRATLNPHTIRLEVYDATPCQATWSIAPAGETTPAHSGRGAQIPAGELGLTPGRYTLAFTATDLCGNTATVEKQFTIR